MQVAYFIVFCYCALKKSEYIDLNTSAIACTNVVAVYKLEAEEKILYCAINLHEQATCVVHAFYAVPRHTIVVVMALRV